MMRLLVAEGGGAVSKKQAQMRTLLLLLLLLAEVGLRRRYRTSLGVRSSRTSLGAISSKGPGDCCCRSHPVPCTWLR